MPMEAIAKKVRIGMRKASLGRAKLSPGCCCDCGALCESHLFEQEAQRALCLPRELAEAVGTLACEKRNWLG